MSRGPGRASSRLRPSKSWTVAQMVAGLHHMVHIAHGPRAAARFVNNRHRKIGKHKLTKSTVDRVYQLLPPHMRLFRSTACTEPALIDFVQQRQSQSRASQPRGSSLLTALEEDLLVEYIQFRHNSNSSIGSEVIKAAALRLLAKRDPPVQYTGTHSMKHSDCGDCEVRMRNELLMSVCMRCCPGSLRHWYDGFQNRHREVSARMAQNITKARFTAQQKLYNIEAFFEKLRAFSELPPEQLYAADETGLDGDGARRELVLAPTNSPRVFRQQDSYREHTSITHIGNAAGQSLAPIVCFEGKLLDADIGRQMHEWNEDAIFGVQENGYFTSDHTLRLLQHIDQHAVKARPLLLILDGASGHIDIEAAQFAIQHEIDILLLPSNCTHFLQVADVSVFGPFKHYWKQACHLLKMERAQIAPDSDISIQREDIVPLAAKAWKFAVTRANVISGFRRTGIYPFDPEAHKRSLPDHDRAGSLTGLPLMFSSASAPRSESSAVAALTTAVIGPPSPPRPAAGKIKKVRRMFSTVAGMLMTGAKAMQNMREYEEAKRAEAEEKAQARLKRAARSAEIVAEKAAKAQRRAVREAAKAVKAAMAAAAAAAAASAASAADEQRNSMGSAADDKENSHPNLPPAPAADVPQKYAVAAVVERRTGAVLRLRAIR
jgi:hypothetical protein